MFIEKHLNEMTLTFQGHNLVNDVLSQISLPAEKIVTNLGFFLAQSSLGQGLD